MPTENPFGRILGDVPDLAGKLDAAVVIRRSRRRRAAQRLAVGGVGALAVIGIVGGIGLGFSSLGFVGVSSSGSASKAVDGAAPEYSGGGGSDTSYGAGGSVGDGATTQPEPQSLEATACPAPLPTVSASATDLSVGVTFPESATEPRGTRARFTLTNTGAGELSIVVAAHSVVVLGSEGRTRWVAISSHLPSVDTSLSANATRSFVQSFDTITCGAKSRSALPAGTYQAIAYLRVTIDGKPQWIESGQSTIVVP